MLYRRQFLIAASLLAVDTRGFGAPSRPKLPALALTDTVIAAELATGGRVGLAVIDTATGRSFSHRGGERFPMASTFKTLLVAAILEQVDRGRLRLDQALPIAAADIVSNSPVAERHVGGTATISDLCEATIIYSDNAAANLLLPLVDGPPGLTAFLRRNGDAVTRLDRYETMMGEATPGDLRDTSSPDATAASWRRLLLGNILSVASRDQLTRWLIANTTGETRLRAGLPKGWRVGDKTGTGGHGSVNAVAIVWPARAMPGPVIIASFLNGGTAPDAVLYRTHGDLARAIAAAITQ